MTMSGPIFKICSNHANYPVPLIFTFAFDGCEWWCPYCNYASGFLGAGENVEPTPELIKRHAIYEQAVKPYAKERFKMWQLWQRAEDIEAALSARRQREES